MDREMGRKMSRQAVQHRTLLESSLYLRLTYAPASKER